ncbi:hypothetical protein GGX14DRAFT_595301 [Mycena pura]|uniref:MYND-type domain-containing protein n=1 Tax=Mycena pura TaxID=153505 RepID=A0AAD6YFJ3_9AGAR|nr:hypothetical protein GGX14DRAFT_595301 [Mycena pura]
MTPVFYGTLDPADVAALHKLDSLDTDIVQRRIHRTLLAFRGLAALIADKSVPREAYHDLWSRIWDWITFLDAFREHLRFTDPSVNRLLIGNTPGVWVVIARAWGMLLHAQDIPGLNGISVVLASVKAGYDCTGIAPLDDLISGAGGGWSDLASFVVCHLKLACPHPDGTITRDNLVRATGIIYILSGALHSHVEFREALWEQGLVTALTQFALALVVNPPLSDFTFLPRTMFTAITSCFTCSHAHKYIVESLRSGFLRVLIWYGGTSDDEVIEQELLPVLAGDLPGSTVWYSVLRQLRISLAQVRDINPATMFGRSDLAQHWKLFLQLADERLKVVDEYEAGTLTALRACDNLECGQVCDKRKLKRCSGCRTAFYCSRICQKSDWRNGHRGSCWQFRQRRIEESTLCGCKDRSFLRALLNRDYARMQEDIALELLRFRHMHPGHIPYTYFDYSSGWCAISVRDTLTPEIEDTYGEEIMRVMRGGGRMQLHLMGVNRGGTCCQWWQAMPLRSASAALDRDLLRISVPPSNGSRVDVESCRSRVRHLLASAGVQTH